MQELLSAQESRCETLPITPRPTPVAAGSPRPFEPTQFLIAEATPEATSAVLRHTQAQFIREKLPRALHCADEVEKVVLVLCRDQLPKQLQLLARLSPHLLRLRRVVAVLPSAFARPL